MPGKSALTFTLSDDSRFGPLLAVLGIIDPDVTRAEAQIAAKNNAGVPGYAGAAVWPTPEAAGQALAADAAAGIDLVIVGAPPHFRGCVRPPADLDLRLIAALPQTRRWLVEKPVSAAPPTESNGQEQVARAYKDTGAVVGAGYMMCALKGVQMIQEMIKAKGLKVMGTAARVSYSLALCCKTHMLTSRPGSTTWLTSTHASRRGGTSKSRAVVRFRPFKFSARASRGADPSATTTPQPSSNKRRTSLLSRSSLAVQLVCPPYERKPSSSPTRRARSPKSDSTRTVPSRLNRASRGTLPPSGSTRAALSGV